jgi:Undecaprenyl-phosphate glucose phosphotransferase
MLKRYHQMVGGVFRAIDLALIGVSWLLAYFVRFNYSLLPVTKGLPKFQTYIALAPLVVLIWGFVFEGMRVYEARRMLRRTDEAQLLVKAHGVALLAFISLTYLITEYRFSRGVMLAFGAIGGVSLLTFRVLLRNGLRWIRRRGFNLRHVLAVGEGPTIEGLVQKLDRFPELGLRVIGAVISESSTATQVAGKPIVGRFSRLEEIVHRTQVDQVLIALNRADAPRIDELLEQLKDETIDIQLVPDIHEYVTLGCEVEDFEGLPIVKLNDSPLSGWSVLTKRVSDIFLAGLALVLLSPIYLVISIAVKLTSKGPIFYGQERMGLDGKTFNMFKFRSMKVDAESKSGAVWATQGDDRRTSIGAFLRATSLDELPQFWNVLRGDMSLVGPRPERPVFVKQFRHEIPHYMLRHKVKAGITGWAQVNGWRGNTSLQKRIEYDLYYIRNWSFTFDMKILVLTLFKGFINKNAY